MHETKWRLLWEECIRRYPEAMLPFGEREDEHAGEQFYNYVVRDFIYGWMKDGGVEPREELFWCAPEQTFQEQLEWYEEKCKRTYNKMLDLYCQCDSVKKSSLWKDSVLLQVQIYKYCIEGSLLFADAYRAYQQKEYKKAFFLLGDGPDFYIWQREVTYSENDSRVILITNMENHMTDWELYIAGKMKRMISNT